MKNLVINLLRLLFLIVYMLIIHFFVWQYLPINNSVGVLVGSLLAIIISFVLALVTVNKLIDILRS